MRLKLLLWKLKLPLKRVIQDGVWGRGGKGDFGYILNKMPFLAFTRDVRL